MWLVSFFFDQARRLYEFSMVRGESFHVESVEIQIRSRAVRYHRGIPILVLLKSGLYQRRTCVAASAFILLPPRNCHALFLSSLTYGIITWGGANKNYFTRVEILQKALILFFYQNRLYPSDLILKMSKLLKVRTICYIAASTCLTINNLMIFNESVINTRCKNLDLMTEQLMKKKDRTTIIESCRQ